MPLIFSQVDLSECKNVTVFLAPSVVSKIMKIALIKLTNLKDWKKEMIIIERQYCLFNIDIYICNYILVFNGSELRSCITCAIMYHIFTACNQVVENA